MSSPRVLATVLVCLALTAGGLGVASAAVPDARLTVDTVTVTPEAPAPGETTTVDVTVASSVGSTTPASIENVSLQDEEESYAVANDLGALSAGDSLTVPLSTAFDEAGIHDLSIVVNATDEEGNLVTVKRPVRIVVGGVDAAGIEDDVQIDVRQARPSDLESSSTGDGPDIDLGVGGVNDIFGGATGTSSGQSENERQRALTEGLVAVDVSNFGTATARTVVVDPDSDAISRVPVENVPPGETRTVLLDVGRLGESGTLELLGRYSLGTDRLTSTTTYEYDPNRPQIRLTDVDMVADGASLELSGNVANVGTAGATGVVVEVGETDHVGPTYPQRSYFVGSVPESDFAGFELTARTDPQNATAVPVRITYVEDGVTRAETVELVYEPREGDVDESGRSIAPFAVLSLVGLSLAGVGAFIWRRRDGAK